MTIEDSERYLRLMLGGMEYAVRYWKDRDKEESDIEQTNVEAVKTALDTMCKYQKIKEVVNIWHHDIEAKDFECMAEIAEVVEDGNDD